MPTNLVSKKRAIREDNKRRFLEQLPTFGTVTKTAQAIGVDFGTAYGWLREDETFSQETQRIKKEIDAKRLEQYQSELDKRALGGEGKMPDVLLMFGLKSLDERYRDRIPETKLTGDITIKLAVPERVYPQLPKVIDVPEQGVTTGNDKDKGGALQGET